MKRQQIHKLQEENKAYPREALDPSEHCMRTLQLFGYRQLQLPLVAHYRRP